MDCITWVIKGSEAKHKKDIPMKMLMYEKLKKHFEKTIRESGELEKLHLKSGREIQRNEGSRLLRSNILHLNISGKMNAFVCSPEQCHRSRNLFTMLKTWMNKRAQNKTQ